MQAVVLDESEVRVEHDRPEPVPPPGESLVRVLRAGICETDLQLVAGYMGFRGVLGHEFVGIATSGPHEGRRVVGEINCPCGNCPTCRAGHGNHCPRRSVLGILNRDGAFAEHLSLPDSNLHPVPDDVPDERAVFVEPLAAACRIPQQLDLAGDERVVVLGDGRLGNLCAQVLRNTGARVRVVGKHVAKLRILDGLGLDTVLLDDLEADRTADVVVDCTGSPSGIETALGIVRPLGTIVLKTTVSGAPPLNLAPVVIDEVRVVGSRCGPFDEALALLRRGDVDVTPLLSGTRPLSEAPAALDEARGPGVLKLLLDPTA